MTRAAPSTSLPSTLRRCETTESISSTHLQDVSSLATSSGHEADASSFASTTRLELPTPRSGLGEGTIYFNCDQSGRDMSLTHCVSGTIEDIQTSLSQHTFSSMSTSLSQYTNVSEDVYIRRDLNPVRLHFDSGSDVN